MNQETTEPLWVGMDVDAELAHAGAQTGERGGAATPKPAGRKDSSPLRSLRAVLPSRRREVSLPEPLWV
jgi:hypothetical protein